MPLRYYRALLIQDEDDSPDSGYGVVFPDLPGCTSAGDTRMEAAEQAAEALSGHVSLLLEEGEGLPAATDMGSALPTWLEGAGRVAGEVLVPVEVPRLALSPSP
jgi:predicted RNase H-like HicB family nuclease